MRNFKIVACLKSGETTSDTGHPLFNVASVAIASCKAALTEKLSNNETSVIYIFEDSSIVQAELPNKTRITFYY